MNQQDIDKQASIELLIKAVNYDSLTIAGLLIESAYRLDNTIPVEEYKQVVRNNWMAREYNKRKELIK